jgi:hypothetical protein
VDAAEALEQQLSKSAAQHGWTFVVERVWADDSWRAAFKDGDAILRAAGHRDRLEALRELKRMVEKDSELGRQSALD